jgi:hypothetical protein
MLHWLTTLLARLKKGGTSRPLSGQSWNGRPRPGAALSQDQAEPAAGYSTLIVPAPNGGPGRPRPAARPEG